MTTDLSEEIHFVTLKEAELGPERPLFELLCGDQKWELYESGEVKGFPPGTVIINRALVKLNQLRALLRMDQNDEDWAEWEGNEKVGFYSFEQALDFARLWKAGKLIGA